MEKVTEDSYHGRLLLPRSCWLCAQADTFKARPTEGNSKP